MLHLHVPDPLHAHRLKSIADLQIHMLCSLITDHHPTNLSLASLLDCLPLSQASNLSLLFQVQFATSSRYFLILNFLICCKFTIVHSFSLLLVRCNCHFMLSFTVISEPLYFFRFCGYQSYAKISFFPPQHREPITIINTTTKVRQRKAINKTM